MSSALLSGHRFRKELVKTLLPNETILADATTPSSGLIVTDQRVIIIKSAPWGLGKIFGTNIAAYSYQQLTGVEIYREIMQAYVEVTGADVPHHPNPTGVEKNTALNIFFFYKGGGMEAKVEQMVEVIRQQITSAQTARNAPSQAAPFSQTFPNIPEQIKQLAALRDAGILTKEEFEQKKA